MIQPTSVASLPVAVTPLIFLSGLLVCNVLAFQGDAISGPIQISLFLAAILTVALGVFVLKKPYQSFEDEIIRSLSHAIPAILILLMVGSLISLWIMSGIVPTMIFYGLTTINPVIFLPISCFLCIITSLATGSSWSTSGTIGIALMGIGNTLGIPPGMTAGAVISGAYFGDKMSPLSETTNIAPAIVGVDVFTHIRHMLHTSLPAIVLALIAYTVLGLFYGKSSANLHDIEVVTTHIDTFFNIGLQNLLIPLVVFYLIYKKVPALPALTIGTILASISVVLFQKDLLLKLLGPSYQIIDVYKLILKTSYQGFSMTSDNSVVDALFSRGGMANMLPTVWLIIAALGFGATLEASGMLEAITKAIVGSVEKVGTLVGATMASCMMLNVIASDQMIAIAIPGRMFRKAYERFGLHPKNLSRVLEDAGTVTSVLVPWNTCGAYNSSVLGVSTLTYLPYCFFNILSPLIDIFFASMNISMERVAYQRHEAAMPSTENEKLGKTFVNNKNQMKKVEV